MNRTACLNFRSLASCSLVASYKVDTFSYYPGYDLKSRRRMNSIEFIFAISLNAFHLQFLIFRLNYDLFYIIELNKFFWLILVILIITHKILPCKLFTATSVHSELPGRYRAYAFETTPNAPWPTTLSIAKFSLGNSQDGTGTIGTLLEIVEKLWQRKLVAHSHQQNMST